MARAARDAIVDAKNSYRLIIVVHQPQELNGGDEYIKSAIVEDPIEGVHCLAND